MRRNRSHHRLRNEITKCLVFGRLGAPARLVHLLLKDSSHTPNNTTHLDIPHRPTAHGDHEPSTSRLEEGGRIVGSVSAP